VSLLEINTSSSMNSLRGRELPSDSSTPRIFCLQRLVEVADFNMHTRPRIAWANIWNRLAAHFRLVADDDDDNGDDDVMMMKMTTTTMMICS
jgi:hypothetical protein